MPLLCFYSSTSQRQILSKSHQVCIWDEQNFSTYLHFQLIFTTIHRSYCTFWYYSWVSLHFLILFMSPTVLFSLFFNIFSTCSIESFQFQLNKLFQTDTKCVFLGYPFGVKGYKVMDIHTHSVFISRNV